MKFFTLQAYNQWYSSFKDNTLLMAAFAQNEHHLQALESALPAHLLTLARLAGVDDGLVIEVVFDRDLMRLQLKMRCGDLRIGYYDLVLNYKDVDLSYQDEVTLTRIARTTKNDSRHNSDLYVHEMDITPDGKIEDRLLFHPGVWLAIRCRTLLWKRVAKPNQKLPQLKDRFLERPIV